MLDSGTKNGAVVASWGSQYGLSITGSAKNTPKDDYDHPLNTLLRWSKTIDLTKYNYLEFQVRKGGGFGSSRVYIGTGSQSYIFTSYYTSLSTSWKHIKVPISTFNGNQILSFVGGYYDTTGGANSNTQYMYMRLYK